MIEYFYDHKDEIEADLAEQTEVASQERLRDRLGDAAFLRLAS
jgi:hypothetical protein